MKINKKILPFVVALSISGCKSFNVSAIDNPFSPDQVKKNTEKLRLNLPSPTPYNPYSTGIDENSQGSVITNPNNPNSVLNAKTVKTVEIKISDPINKDNPTWYSPAIEESGYKKKIVALLGTVIKEVTASVTLSDNTRSTNIKWSSSDNSIVNINADSGQISIGQRAGKVTVSAISVIDPSKKDLIEIEVVDQSNFTLNELAKVNSITASVANINGGNTSNRWKADSINMVRAEIGSEFQVFSTVTLLDGTKNSRVLWESSDENIVKVSQEGKVTPVGIGVASVVARYRLNPLKKAIVDVSVVSSIPDNQFVDYVPVATPMPTSYPQYTPTPVPTMTPEPTPTATPKPVVNNSLILVDSDNTEMSAFYITKYEITQKEWKSIISANPSSQVDDSLPVSNVSWLNAIKYCNQRSTKEGLPVAYNNAGELLDTTGVVTTDLSIVKGYRLPTVEEWEFAAKGGTKSFNFTYSGNNDYSKVAWSINDSSNKIQYPGQKEPNELGIYDMSGNIYEWTHSSSTTEDTTKKILKGGSYVTLETDVNNRTVSLETNISNSPTYGNLGFRIVRTK